MKKWIVTWIIAAMAAGLLAGCGAANDKNTGAGTGNNVNAGGGEDKAQGNAARGLISVISREDGSGTRGAFTELFGIQQVDQEGNKVDMTTREATIVTGTQVILSNVASDPGAIGYVSLGALKDTVKALKINGVEASVTNINNGTYKAYRPFIIATKGTPSEVTQDFINFILSAQGQEVVAETYIPVSQNAVPFESNGAAGKIKIDGSSSVTPVMEKLVEAYLNVNTGAEIELQTSDSSTGLLYAMDGTADIGMASRELKDSESSLTATAIAMDGIVVIVNKQNAVDDMTTDEVKAIFTGEKTIW